MIAAGDRNSAGQEAFRNDDFACLDEVRDELIDGETVLLLPRPARNHNLTAGNLF